jgi:hypothetical protein
VFEWQIEYYKNHPHQSINGQSPWLFMGQHYLMNFAENYYIFALSELREGYILTRVFISSTPPSKLLYLYGNVGNKISIKLLYISDLYCGIFF